MIIEESVLINAPLDKIWQNFTDLTCWAKWNSVLKNAKCKHATVQKGETFSCTMRPFLFAVSLEPYTEELVLNERVVWSGSKYGVFARHEFIFQNIEDRVLVTSRETFKGIIIENMKFLFPDWRIRELTIALLKDLKKASETG